MVDNSGQAIDGRRFTKTNTGRDDGPGAQSAGFKGARRAGSLLF
jgi:hypothetical protein